MATNIIIMGLPGDIKFTKLLNKFRAYFKRINIKMFWIRDTIETEGGQQLTIELVSMSDARKARNFLNNQAFIHEMNEYPMEVHLENGGGHFANEDYESHERRPRPAKRNRPRSRSPGFRQEASKLDMEIELLRKQRLVIEEERRLLLEQKKLEMIKEYGPSASRDFDDYEPPRKKRQAEPVSRPRPRSPITKAPKNRPQTQGLPAFFQPCKKLISQMKPHIEKCATHEEVGILIKLIRAAIRKELAITLEGKAFIPTVDILKMYREKHPKEQDEAFVSKILANIRASYLTTEIKVEKDDGSLKEIKKEKVSDIEADDAQGNDKATENGNGTNDKATENDNSDKDIENDAKGTADEVANNEIAPKDTANGDNETDGPAPDIGVVKTELNTSQELENIPAGTLPEAVETNTVEKTATEAALDDFERAMISELGGLEDSNTEETTVQ